ncbi:hypothetical protein BpHYR1_053639 [Brachionus plicatilis]|uniref:Uncharacterized protein n=1 Tax=Brachionus plicatilis TaxID=10195 RepID=A0A3M7QQS4_BRAPC|nr:hypothetical protein BpHYR1_053639 [Brachionus plicatilis]
MLKPNVRYAIFLSQYKIVTKSIIFLLFKFYHYFHSQPYLNSDWNIRKKSNYSLNQIFERSHKT